MSIRKISIYSLTFSLYLLSSTLFSQDLPLIGQFTPQQWSWMEKRWNQYITWLDIHTTGGQTHSGQLIRLDSASVLIQPDHQIVTNPESPSNWISIPLDQISDIDVKRGGHPYQGLLIGGVAGAPPGIIGGAILAMGWSIIPPIVLGTITTVAGGWVGQKIQQKSRTGHYDFADTASKSRFVTRLQTRALLDPFDSTDAPLPSPNSQILAYRLSPLIYPVNPWSLSLRTGPLTNRVRDHLMRWYDGYIWGPVSKYYEYQIAVDLGIARRVDPRMQIGLQFNMVPGDVGYFYIDKHLPDFDISYNMNLHFEQQSLGLFAGYLLQPCGRFMDHRLEGSINGGIAVSHIFEHFYLQWNRISQYEQSGETFTRTSRFIPGLFMMLDADYYLIPGISINAGITGYWFQKADFGQRDVLPETVKGPLYIPAYRVQFSNIQAMIGVKVHF